MTRPGYLRRFQMRWLSALLAAVSTGCAMSGSADQSVKECFTPPVQPANAHYAGNRDPLLPSPLIKLPVGAVQPEGWVRHQLELMAEGMTGRLTELSPWLDLDKSAWKDPKVGGMGWEEAPYWLKGFVSMAYILNNQKLINESKRWIEATLATQQPDGWFGPLDNLKANDFWPNMIMLYALRSHYEATGDQRVIPFMTRYFEFQNKLPKGELFKQIIDRGWWQTIRAADNLDSVLWLYNRTGEPWLIELAKVNHAQTQDWTNTVPSWHGVNICESYRGPAQFYMVSRDRKHLVGSISAYERAMGIYGQVPGGMFGADENAREGYIGPRQGAETCSIVEFVYSHAWMARITGEVLWADRCEDVAFNSMPASMTPDLKGLHYLTCPNQIQLDRANKSPMIQNGGDMFSYTPYKQYRCCQHNVAMGWPFYAEHLWMATPGNGLAAVLYAPCHVKAKVGDGTEVTITEKTDYPFDQAVEFKIAAGRPVKFPLSLRVPGWCPKVRFQINGGLWDDREGAASSWLIIDRTWNNGDTVRMEMCMPIRTQVWQANQKSVSVSRGPLTYSLKIGEDWRKYKSDGDWPGWEVFPTSAWNYGLIVDRKKPETSFSVVRKSGPIPGQPFTPDAAPIMLKARGKRLPQWKQEANGLVCELPESPVQSAEPVEDLTLIPMGAARLRISAFPQVE